MTVAIVDYGTFKTYIGTQAEVATALAGIAATNIISVYYDSGATKVTAWVRS